MHFNYKPLVLERDQLSGEERVLEKARADGRENRPAAGSYADTTEVHQYGDRRQEMPPGGNNSKVWTKEKREDYARWFQAHMGL